MSEPFFTVGHSRRTLTEFTELLQGSHVEAVVDAARPSPGTVVDPHGVVTYPATG